MTEVVESILNTKSSYNDCDHCSSVLSPAAYFVKLMETVEKYIEQPTNGKDLKSRRPDLYNIKLDCDNTNKEKLYLEIVNKIMEENLDKKLDGNALQKLATAKYPFNLPANFPLMSVRAHLKEHSLAEIQKILVKDADTTAESLGLSPEEYELITSKYFNSSEVYGASESELKNAEKFIAQTNIDHDKLWRLIDCYNKIKKPTNKLSINSGNIDNIDQALGFLNRFIRLANKLSWSFEELCEVLTAIGKDEIDKNSLKEMSGIKSLQARLKKPLSEVCKLYSNASILIEASKSEGSDNTAESLKLSPEEYNLITSQDFNSSEVYGASESELKNVEKFIAQTGIDDKLKLLLDSYNKIKKLPDSTRLSIDSANQSITNLDNQVLGFLHRFIRLANKLNWSFEELCDVLVAVGKDEINADFVKQIARIKNLQERFKQPVTKIVELYAQEDILSKKVEALSEGVENPKKFKQAFDPLLNGNYRKLQELTKNANNYSALQKILGVSSSELTSLIEYNNNTSSQTGKLLLFKVYKQVSLARLIGISIAEITQFLSLLNIDELNLDSIEHVVELNDWLKNHSITIQQLNNLVNPSELIKKQASEIGQVEEKEILYNKISKHVQIQRDILDAAYEFTTKYGQSLTEKLLHNIAIFTMLKLSAEDISNITKHGNAYGMQAEWSLSQIKTLVNYKTLKDIFSSGGITQYTDWLNGTDYNENKVVEKIAQLTGWNKDTLEDIKGVEALKPCFTETQNPIDSLIKIKSFMDLVTKSGINSKVLLSLKDLYNLAVGSDNSGWKKYADAAENLKLSAKSEAKAEKYLAEQKRDILAKYMIHEYELKNMRDLYSYLLIDVEMSDCSVISPLKAALNSVQLYIHRCMMKLEKDVKIKPELNEEKWKWLSHYREWEASNKIKLYPENYLNPTLRRITTPGYKTLQNTLMQGNITDESVSNAYMKYFEDFEEVTNLKIVDSCFERVEDKISGEYKNTLYIIGRTLAQPYNYYYRTAIFDKKNQQILYWTAWEKIGASIPVETVTPIYAFHRLFLFWVQQTRKKKIDIAEYNKDNTKNSPLSENAHVTINYTFQKPSGSWTAPQKLADNIEVDSTKEDYIKKDVDKLYWRKVAAFYLKEGEEKNVVISIGEIKSDKCCLFILDEDLIANKKVLKFFEDIQDNSELKSTTRQLFYDIDKSKKEKEDKLSLKFTKSIFKSNATNGEDSAEFVANISAIEVLEKFKISSAQQIVNKPGWFIIEGNLERENIRESFLLFPKEYDLSSISERSIYEVNGEEIKLKYDSRIPQVDLTDTEFEFIRLNITGSVRKLRQKAYAGGPKRILTLDSQKIKQLDFTRFQPTDAVVHYPPDILDFSGAYSIYLWEIFFHIPTLIAWHLNGEQNFSAAREWYQYILNPTNDKSQAWRFLPFTNRNKESITNDLGNTQTIKELEEDPFDPYVIAKQRPTAFEKYIIKSYIDNLINWGDNLFAKKSWETLNQATMLYVRAWDLLGHKPIKKGKFTVEAKTFEELKSNQESGTLCRLETELPSTNVQLAITQAAHEVYDMSKYGCYFCKPENEEFIGLWDKIEDRLYKIRHCLEITGKRSELPLFQAPMDPRQLIQTISASGSDSSIVVPSIDQLPHYRFSYMIAYARSIVETVVQFGSELLSVLEKRDAEALAILYNKQEGIIANLITSIKEKAIEALKEEAKALDASLSSAKDRESHYENLINSGLSAGEILATALSADAVLTRVGIATVRGAAAVAHLIPTVFGFADGAFQPGSAIAEGANIAESAAMILNEGAQIAYTVASYKRRAEDWELQRIMASHDTEQINYQIEANKVNQGNAEQDLKAHKKSIEQIKEKEEFFKNKFTNQELYNWMKGQISIIYFQAYKIALEIAKQAEKTYQYELNNNKSFITNNSWNSFKEGLLAGSVLKFALEQMSKGYHDENKRALEISKVVSLRQINPIALHELKTNGSCKFELTERLFDLDFPGHYCRKIKNIKITIPAVVGPYENIHASLQQTSNKVVLKPDIEAIKYLLEKNGSGKPGNDILRENWQQNQEIALSRGDQDSGLFELNFNDERYLPFEGTGIVSCWELSLPKATNRIDTNKISDVIIHIDYTAFDGGKVLRDEVKTLSKLKYYHGMLLVNLSTTYPDAWEKFKQTQSELKFKPSAEIFPTYVKTPEIDLDADIYIIPKASTQIGDIKLNDHVWVSSTCKITINSEIAKPAIDSDWNIKVNNAEISQIEEIAVVIPYKAEINW